MLSFIDFFNIIIIGITEAALKFYFFMKLTGRRAKWYSCLVFAAAVGIAVYFLPKNPLLQLVFCTVLLSLTGIVIYKENCKITILYAVITVEVMQACYGVFHPVSGILSPLFYSYDPGAAGLFFMTAGNFLALTLSCLCYTAICKYFPYSENEKNQYVLMIVTPLLLIFLLDEYMNNTVYGDTVILNGRGDMLNANHFQMLFIQLFSIFSLFCIIYAYKKLTESFKISTELSILEQERRWQTQYVSEAKLRYDKTRLFRHDIKNHLSVLHGLLKQGNVAEAEKYLENMEALSGDLSFPCSTGNPVLDILIGNKLGAAKNSGVNVSCSLKVPCPCLITDMDFCIILSNALDNAVHACERIKEGKQRKEKFIQVSGRRQGDLFLIEVKNSNPPKESIPVSPGNRTVQAHKKEPSFKTGTGLSSIRSICEKYNGAVGVSDRDGMFQLSALLIIPQHTDDIPRQKH